MNSQSISKQASKEFSPELSKAFNGENGAGTTGLSTRKRLRLDSYFLLHKKLNSNGSNTNMQEGKL